MHYNFAIVYFGLTRSTKKVYKSHYDNIFNHLKANNYTYKTFMHTWKTKNNQQKIWCKTIKQEIDYNEYKLLNPDFYEIESQEDFLDNLNIKDFFYEDIYKKYGNNGEKGEWFLQLIKNHLCAIESQRRAFINVQRFCKNDENQFDYVIFIRPDVQFHNKLPLENIKKHINNENTIHIPNFAHHEGYNDRFAVLNYVNSSKYANRILDYPEFRKKFGRIVAEKYIKLTVEKYNLNVNKIDFKFDIIRP